ncbi:MAG: YjjW family glycine radical enzyme activase [Erysipelotrichaceae bacterium]
MEAKVNRIIPFSNVDGPGNRMAIFLQGCPFNCWYCHNPETINSCIHCGQCISSCDSNALTLVNEKVVWNPLKCIGCDCCIQVCEHCATPKITMYTVEQLMDKIRYQKAFIQGITVSGGECMMYASFIEALAIACKNENISMLIDSNGYQDFSKYPVLMEHIDGVMLDVKAYDASFHQLLTGSDNEVVLKNLSYLLSINKLEEVRTVLLPNYLEESIETVTQIVKLLNHQSRYKLLKYRPYGVRAEYLKQLGNQIFDDQKLEEIKNHLNGLGYNNIVCI